MTLRVKPGVSLEGLQPIMLVVAWIYDYLRTALGWGDGTITSGTDQADDVGARRVADTLHARGLAVDLRTVDLSDGQASQLASMLARVLEPYGFQVILERDHIHVELDGKRRVLT